MPAPSWAIYFYKRFLTQYNGLIQDVEHLKARDPVNYVNRFKPKLLKKLHNTINLVANDPCRAEFRLGKTLGQTHASWRRIKITPRYRAFFKFFSSVKETFFVWLNDENTLRQRGSSSDVYVVFQKMLNNGEIPSDHKALRSDSEFPPTQN